MAKGDKSNRTGKLTIRQEIATDTYANQTFNNLNPSITDETTYIIANRISGLTSKSLDKVIRTEKYDIVYE